MDERVVTVPKVWVERRVPMYPGAPKIKCGECGHEFYPRKRMATRLSPLRCPSCKAYLDPQVVESASLSATG